MFCTVSFEHALIQRPGLRQRGAERLLDDHPHLRVDLAREAAGAEALHDRREQLRRGREVEGAVQALAGLFVEAVEHARQLPIQRPVVERAGQVAHVLEQPPQHVLVGRPA